MAAEADTEATHCELCTVSNFMASYGPGGEENVPSDHWWDGRQADLVTST